jgi:hypothetical protein
MGATVKLKDLIDRHETYEQHVRAMETRAFPWYTDYELGLEDGTWYHLDMEPGWTNGNGFDEHYLEWAVKSDTVHLRGQVKPGSVTPGLPIASVPLEQAPEFEHHWHLYRFNPPSATYSVVIGTDGLISLEAAVTFPDTASIALPNHSWPLVTFRS